MKRRNFIKMISFTVAAFGLPLQYVSDNKVKLSSDFVNESSYSYTLRDIQAIMKKHYDTIQFEPNNAVTRLKWKTDVENELLFVNGTSKYPFAFHNVHVLCDEMNNNSEVVGKKGFVGEVWVQKDNRPISNRLKIEVG